jgi:hypothetical protein
LAFTHVVVLAVVVSGLQVLGVGVTNVAAVSARRHCGFRLPRGSAAAAPGTVEQ